MSNINATLATARRALLAQQAALAVTSDNIANVNTPGYARRRGELTPGPTIYGSDGGFGTGVSLENIQSVRDVFVERQLHRVSADAARYDTSGGYLQVIETAMGALGEANLSSALDRFWTSWQELASDPTSRGARSLVQAAGRNVASNFNSIARSLDEQSNQVNQALEEKIGRVNVLLRKMTEYNREYLNKIGSGEFDDDRTKIMDELARLTGATFNQRSDGSISVVVGGFSVVDGGNARELRYEKGANGAVTLLPLFDGAAPLILESGEVTGLMEVRDEYIAGLRTKLDRIAVSLAREVNALHSTGYDFTGAEAGAFFSEEVTGIGNFRLSDAVEDDPGKIAASLSGRLGDNSLALQMAELGQTLTVDGETFNSAYASAASEFGAQINEVALLGESAQASLMQVEAWRESISGVSLNEEMSRLIQFENAFNAAAKLTQTISQMMDIIVGIA